MAANFCNECGAKLKANEKSCANCGKAVEVVAKPVDEQPAQEQTQQAPAVKPLTPPTKEEKNKLILLMVVSIIIPIVGFVFAIIMYTGENKDKKSGMHYLLCGLSGLCFGLGGAYWLGFVVGAVLIASVVYNAIKQINAGEIKAP